MKFGLFIVILVLVLSAIRTSAVELKNNQREERNLRIELEVIPAPVQQDFDKYIQDLAASAPRDARAEEQAQKDQAAKDRQMKVVNPLVLFRW